MKMAISFATVIKSRQAQEIYSRYNTQSPGERDEELRGVLHLEIVDDIEASELYPFALQPFTNLKHLRLNRCPPSIANDLFNLRNQLITLDIQDSGIPDVSKVLAPIPEVLSKKFKPMIMSKVPVPINSSIQWNSLVSLKLNNCGIAQMDKSFHLFPVVEEMELRNNSIAHIIHLQDCVQLKRLDLSHNRIRILSNISRVLGNVKVLSLSNNRIQSLDGISKLISLAMLDVSANGIDDFVEVQQLSELPFLEAVMLTGNPVADHPDYRVLVFQNLLQNGSIMSSSRELPALDNEPLTKQEEKILRGDLFRAPETEQRELSRYVHVSIDDLRDSLFETRSDEDIQTDRLSFLAMHRKLEATEPDALLAPSSFERLSFRMSRNSRNSASSSSSPHSLSRLSLARIMPLVVQRSRRVAVVLESKSGFEANAEPLSLERVRFALAESRKLAREAREAEEFNHLKKRGGFLSEMTSSFSSRFSESPPCAIKETAGGTSSSNDEIVDCSEGNVVHLDLKTTEAELMRPYSGQFEIEHLLPSLIENNEKTQGGANEEQIESSSEDYIPITERLRLMRLEGHQESNSETIAVSQDSPKPVTPPRKRKSINVATSSSSVSSKTKQVSWAVAASNAIISGTSTTTTMMPGDADLDELLTRSTSTVTSESDKESSSVSSTTVATAADAPSSRLLEYIGAPEYRNLSVWENLELYFREQVFGSRKSKGGLIERRNAYVAMDLPKSYSGPPLERITEKVVTGLARHLIPTFTPPRTERFSTLFTVKLVDLSMASSSSTKRQKESSSRRSADKGSDNPEDLDENSCLELLTLLVLTDVSLYLIYGSSIPSGSVFADAPMPILYRAHPLHHLSSLTNYFGYQRFALKFRQSPIAGESNDALNEIVVGRDFAGCWLYAPYPSTLSQCFSYLVITRDKTLTYPIITRIPQLANSAKCLEESDNATRDTHVKADSKEASESEQSPARKTAVAVVNKDSELLDEVARVTRQHGNAETDVLHYQMLLQYWKKRPGVLLARSLVLTSSMLFLCEEDLSSIDVRLTVLDSVKHRTGVSKIKTEENPLHVTLYVKGSGVFRANRKWRLATETSPTASRLIEVLRKRIDI